MKFAAVALVAAAQAASFPSFDSLHAHCQLTTTFQDSCANVYASLDNTVKTFKDPANGAYALVQEQSNDYVWVTRTTPTKHYVDDIIFTVKNTGNANTCTVVSKSRSETLSYYDYDTNLCNMYNVFRSQSIKFDTPTTQDCKYFPSAADLLTTCNTY